MTRWICWGLLCALSAGCSDPTGEYQRAGTPAMKLEVRRASPEPREGWEEVTNASPPPATLYLSPEVLVSNADVVSTGVSRDESGHWRVNAQLTDDARHRFADATDDLASAPGESRDVLAFLFDGEVISAPFVTAPIRDGLVPIRGPFDEEKARRIASGLVGR